MTKENYKVRASLDLYFEINYKTNQVEFKRNGEFFNITMSEFESIINNVRRDF